MQREGPNEQCVGMVNKREGEHEAGLVGECVCTWIHNTYSLSLSAQEWRSSLWDLKVCALGSHMLRDAKGPDSQVKARRAVENDHGLLLHLCS